MDSLYECTGPLCQAAGAVLPLAIHEGLVHHVAPVTVRAPAEARARGPVLLVPSRSLSVMKSLRTCVHVLLGRALLDAGGAAAVHHVLHEHVALGAVLGAELLQRENAL